MIVIDGNETELNVNNFQNLEEIFLNLVENDKLTDRVVTEVLVDNESFSEIYPHQAEDISVKEFERVEINTVPAQEMAVSITEELQKVARIMEEGGKQVAELFRQADDAEALETYQDLLDVVRDFLSMIGVLRDEFNLEDNAEFNNAVEEISDLFTEMSEVMENEDWILLADLLEYEFAPVTEQWKKVITTLNKSLRADG